MSGLEFAEAALAGSVLGWVVYDTGRALFVRLVAAWRRARYADARRLAHAVSERTLVA